jgi:hypothetical protein
MLQLHISQGHSWSSSSTRTKWHGDWTKKQFYEEVDSEQREEFKGLLMSPLNTSFGLKRLKCMLNEATGECCKAFNTIIKRLDLEI